MYKTKLYLEVKQVYILRAYISFGNILKVLNKGSSMKKMTILVEHSCLYTFDPAFI